MKKIFYNHFFLILVNAYLTFCYFLIFPFYFIIPAVKKEYFNQRLIEFSPKSILVFLIFLFCINFFYFLFYRKKNLFKFIDKLFTQKYDINICLLIIILLYLGYYFLKTIFINDGISFNYFLSPNILTFLIINFLFYKGLKEKNKIFKIIIFFTIFIIFLFINKFSSINAKVTVLLSLSFLVILYYRFDLIKIFFTLFMSIIFLVLFLIFENHNRSLNLEYLENLTQNNDTHINDKKFRFEKEPISIYQNILIRLAQFHILNNVVHSTTTCKNEINQNVPKYIANYFWSPNYYDVDSNIDLTDDLYNFVILDKQFMNKNYLLSKKDVNRQNYFEDYEKCLNSCKDHVVDVYLFQNGLCQNFQKGKYYPYMLIDLLPGSLHKYFENNIKNKYGNYFGRNFLLINYDDTKTGVGQNLFGDLFHNFGYFGIIFLSIISLFILIYNRIISYNTNLLPIISLFFTLSIMAIENSFIAFFILNLKFILFLFFLSFSQLMINFLKTKLYEK